MSDEQRFTFWFTSWPATHVNAGKTVEVMPRAVHEAEVERLKAESQPGAGVMHSADKAFYRLAVKERDHERQRVDRLAETVGRLREERDEWRRISAEQQADYGELQAENRRLRELWKDETLITRLFEAHMRGDVSVILREALTSDPR